MYTVVLDGGPCGGKSTTSRRMKEKYGEFIFCTPEIASCLLKELIPLPGRDTVLSPEWLCDFQSAVLPVQIVVENMWKRALDSSKVRLMLIDRGALGGSAYFPPGLLSFMETFELSFESVFARYNRVILLETLAVCKPGLFSKIDNAMRYEDTAEEAIVINDRIKNAWQNHPDFHYIPSNIGIDEIVKEVDRLIQPFIL